MSQIECFKCEEKGHIARNCGNQGNIQGGPHSLQARGVPISFECSTIEHIPAVSFHTSTKSAAYATGKINGLDTDMLLNSGASCSVVHSEYVLSNEVKLINSTTLINANGSKLPLVGTITAHITLNDLDIPHTFIVVDSLSSPVILGCDFLLRHHVTLNFGNGTFYCESFYCESPSAQP